MVSLQPGVGKNFYDGIQNAQFRLHQNEKLPFIKKCRKNKNSKAVWKRIFAKVVSNNGPYLGCRDIPTSR